jgi:hypothetical protein
MVVAQVVSEQVVRARLGAVAHLEEGAVGRWAPEGRLGPEFVAARAEVMEVEAAKGVAGWLDCWVER